MNSIWTKRARTIGLHTLFWFLVVLYFAWGFGLDINPKQSFINALFFIPGHILVVYSLLYFLVPKFLLHRKYWQFFLGFLMVIVICAVYTIIAQLSVNNNPALQGANFTVGRNILPYVHVAAIAASIKLLKYWFSQKRQTLEAERQRTVAELQLLKAQLHPHFLFNTLNNLYSHTLEFSPKSPEIVLKLSALLRFMIYESNVTRIPLNKELELLENYISLERLRYGDRLDLSFTVSGEIDKYQIAPLLLLPFLENAFKHGTSKQIDLCWISLNIVIEEEKMIFKLVNSIDPIMDSEDAQTGGLGLENVKRRLQLLYEDRFELKLERLEEVFVVQLKLELERLEEKYVDHIQFNQMISR